MANSIFDREKGGLWSRREFVAGVGIVVAGAAVPAGAAELAQQGGRAGKTVKLFNGKDLSGLTTWLRALGKNNDPNKVFTVHDGLLHITGETYGAALTDKEYENYHVVAEWKWGEKTWAPKPGARDSGLLLHCGTDDGGFRGDWPEAIEFQIYQGAVGDFILMGTGVTIEGEMRDDKLFHYVPGKPAEARETKKDGKPTGITYILPHLNRDPDWKNVLDFAGKDDAEKPKGEWNTIEAICDRGTITNIVNGRTVNKCSNAHPSRGRIGFQSEGSEIFVRRWELSPL